MSIRYLRPLHTLDLATGFVSIVLDLNDKGISLLNCDLDSVDRVSKRLMKAELLVAHTKSQETLTSTEQRFRNYKTEVSRQMLRVKIFEELIKLKRLDNDDDIKLGSGGALPQSPICNDKIAYIITGLPASGKSRVANSICDKFGAIVVDSDYAKRKIPEFEEEFGPNIVHEESSLITFGRSEDKYSEEPNVFDYCVSQGINMVLPKIGHSLSSLEQLRDKLISYGYKVHLTLVSLDRQKSTTRALVRFLKTNRYVPLSLIFDCYGNEPTLTYYRTKKCPKWASVGKISTDVGPEELPIVKDVSDGNPVELFMRG